MSERPHITPGTQESAATDASRDVPFAGFGDDWSAAASPVPIGTEVPPVVNDPSSADGSFSPLVLRDRVTIMLLFREKVQVEQVEAAWRTWRTEGARGASIPLWRYLLSLEGIDREAIFAEAAEVYAFPKATVTPQQAIRFLEQHIHAFTELQWEQMRRFGMIPIAREPVPQTSTKRWIFATHDPTRPEVAILLRKLRLDVYDLQYVSEIFTTTVVSSALQFRNTYLLRVNRAGKAKNLGTTFDRPEIDESALEAEIAGSTLINLFEAMLVEGVRRGASDLHVFVNANRHIEIHFRIDGQLNLWRTEEESLPEAFLAVVKDNAIGIDRFERDTAQDGYIQRLVDDVVIRFRVSAVPLATARSEEHFDSIVIRILDDRKVVSDLERLGFEGDALTAFNWAISEPHGMVIITGPTGSGKSTTLYAALSRVVNPRRNVLSVEDPVEYLAPGVRQVKLSHRFRVQDAIRSILRHDPDVVMVGEMRDRETADLAIKLANTGHLTFSTLHTNDSASAISRLYNMGLEPFLIANALTLIVSQRLVRLLCPNCRRVDASPDPILLGRAGLTIKDFAGAKLYHAGADPSCTTCNGTGYKGRRAVLEVMPMSEEIRRLILMGGAVIDEDAIREVAAIQGMTFLVDAALALVRDGLTSLEEAMSVGIGRSTSARKAAQASGRARSAPAA